MLFLFLAFGIAASVSDIATRRVSNRLISMAFLSILVGYAFLLIETLLGSHKIVWMGIGERYLPYSFYRGVVINLLLCAISAVVLWRRRIWPAGDAKFFVATSLFLPLIRVDIPGFPDWIFLKLLINTFIPAAVFIVIVSAIQEASVLGSFSLSEILDQSPKVFRRWSGSVEFPSNRKHLALIAGRFILFAALIQILMSALNIFGAFPRLILYLFSYLIWQWLYRFVRFNFFGVLVAVVLVLCAFLAHSNFFSLIIRGTFLALGFVPFFLLLRFLEAHLQSSRAHMVKISEISQGDVLDDESWRKLYGLCCAADSSCDLRRYADGLSPEDIRVIRRCCPLDSMVTVLETRPFAFWVFLGALWTLYTHEIVLRWPLALMGIH